MQDADIQGFDSSGAPRPFLRWMGAALSVGLIAILVIWAWRLGNRNVNDIPVILAQEGPMRVAPRDPGGEQAAHQGRAVNALIEGRDVDPAQVEVATAPAAIEPEPAAPEDDGPAADAADGEETGEEEIELSAYAPAAARPPRPRPEALPTDGAVSPEVPVVTEEALPLRAEDIPVGAHMVQLGTYDTEETALLQWADILYQEGDLLDGKQRYVEPTASGGEVRYRLRAVGYADATEARATCAALVPRGLECIPVQKQ